MRVAHWSLFAPGQSGMYETTKDLVIAQREAGIDSGLICMNSLHVSQRDGAFVTETTRYADLADIYVLHSRIEVPFYGDGTPIVFVMHGHPLYTWQSEIYGLEPGNAAPWTTSLNYFLDFANIQRAVTFWPDQLGYWQVLDGPRAESRLRSIPRGIVFGNRYRPDGDKALLAGSPVLVVCDSFRLFKDSLATWFGAAIFARKYPEARLHLFAMPDAGNLIGDAIRRLSSLSEMHAVVARIEGLQREVEKVFRGADILLSTVRGESCVAIEAAACGCDVITQSAANTHEADFRSPAAIAETIERVWLERQAEGPERRERLYAETVEAYDITRTVEGMKAVYEELL